MRNNPLIDKMLTQPLDHLHLLVRSKASDGHLNHAPNARLMRRDETLIVHKRKRPHDKLAVHPIRDAAVARDRVAKVLDLERALDAAGEEAAKGRDQRGKRAEDENVQLHRLDVDCAGQVRPVGRDEGERVCVL